MSIGSIKVRLYESRRGSGDVWYKIGIHRAEIDPQIALRAKYSSRLRRLRVVRLGIHNWIVIFGAIGGQESVDSGPYSLGSVACLARNQEVSETSRPLTVGS